MNETEFCYWLRGFFELSNSTTLTEEQVKMIHDHLELVFVNVTKDQATGTKPQFRPAPPPSTIRRENQAPRKLCSNDLICSSDDDTKFC